MKEVQSLASGKHVSPADGACLLEAVSMFAGEHFTDHPQCVCPVLAAFGRAINDYMPQQLRNELLLPLIPQLVGTRRGVEVELVRGYAFADWAVRVIAPIALRAAGLEQEADTLQALAQIVDATTAIDACAAAYAARAASAAADAADAAAAAYDAAAYDAAADATDAAAYAARAASAAADAADATAADADASRQVWESAAKLLESLCQKEVGL